MYKIATTLLAGLHFLVYSLFTSVHNIEMLYLENTQSYKTVAESEYIKLSYFNQIWMNSMDKENKKTGNKSVTDKYIQ